MVTTPGPDDPNRPDHDRPDLESDHVPPGEEPVGREDRARHMADDATTTRSRGDEPGPAVPVSTTRGGGTGIIRGLSIALIVGGVILCLAGVVTWVVVSSELSDQKITVEEDADRFAGDKVKGPFTAYSQADIIDKHALEDTGGLTYAELPQDDPRRETVMTASFLRASLFTSVVSFGVAAFAFGMGVLTILIGVILLRVARELATRLAVR